CSMFDGSLSFLAMLAGEMFATGSTPRRGELALGGGIICYRPYRCADGYVTLGALEPKFWAEFCRGVGREDLLDHAFDPPGSDAHRAVCEVFAARTRARWGEFASEHDCCLEPVLGLDEALEGDLVAAREMVVELDQPGAERPVRLLGAPFKLSRTPADPVRAPGPGLGEHTRQLLAEVGYPSDDIDVLLESGAVAGPAADAVRPSFMA
ncbi:MAG: CoA transferase, partial [Solirubrobacteraceae bacterium]